MSEIILKDSEGTTEQNLPNNSEVKLNEPEIHRKKYARKLTPAVLKQLENAREKARESKKQKQIMLAKKVLEEETAKNEEPKKPFLKATNIKNIKQKLPKKVQDYLPDEIESEYFLYGVAAIIFGIFLFSNQSVHQQGRPQLVFKEKQQQPIIGQNLSSTSRVNPFSAW